MIVISPIYKTDYTDFFKITIYVHFAIGGIKKTNRWHPLLERAVGQVVVYHAGCLHVGITDRRTEELKTAFFHVLADGI